MSGVELNVSIVNKEKLKCSECKGYLLCSPIRLLPNGDNVCGLCKVEDQLAYRNTLLEALLQDAMFPCKYNIQGCPERLQFLTNIDHQKFCSFNKPEPSNTIDGNDQNMETEVDMAHKTTEMVINFSASTSKAIDSNGTNIESQDDMGRRTSESMIKSFASPSNAVNGNDTNMESQDDMARKTSEKVVKSSASVSDQQPSTSSPVNQNSNLVYPKVSQSAGGTAAHTNASIASDTPGTSRPNRPIRYSNPASSVASNENRNTWGTQYNRHYSQHHRPYNVGWGFNNLFNRREGFHPDHVMYKRRNNVIIIKGGTFYVNW